MNVQNHRIIAQLTVTVPTPLVVMSVPVIVGIWMKDLDMCVLVCTCIPMNILKERSDYDHYVRLRGVDRNRRRYSVSLGVESMYATDLLNILILHDTCCIPIFLSIQSDIDECAMDTDSCHMNANCTNTVGSYTCMCWSGYSGDGTVCEG